MPTAIEARSQVEHPTERDPRWAALVARDKSADGQFYYSVQSTGVYCRPSSPSRRPLRRNVVFLRSRKAAFNNGLSQWSSDGAGEKRIARLVEQAGFAELAHDSVGSTVAKVPGTGSGAPEGAMKPGRSSTGDQIADGQASADSVDEVFIRLARGATKGEAA